MRHRIRQTHITDELQTGKAAGAAGGFPASGAQYHPLTSAPPRSRPVQSQFMTQAYRALHHNGGMVVKYPVVSGSHAVQPPQTDNFIQLLFRDAGMQAKFGNSKVTVTLAIMLSPIFTWIKRRLGVCQLLPQRGSVFIRFRRHHDFQYRIQIAGLFFCSPDLCL